MGAGPCFRVSAALSQSSQLCREVHGLNCYSACEVGDETWKHMNTCPMERGQGGPCYAHRWDSGLLQQGRLSPPGMDHSHSGDLPVKD